MPKIGIDVRMAGIGHGGIGRYVSELVQNLLKLDSKNQYFLFYNEENANGNVLEVFENFKNARLVKTNIKHYSWKEQLAFPGILNRYNLDLVHFPNFNVPLFYKRPFVATIHDTVHHKISGAKKSRWPHFLAYKKIINHAVLKAQKVITVSNGSAEDICSYLKIAKSKLAVIYEGSLPPVEVSEKQLNEITDKFYLQRPYFLFVGVLERKKNLISLTKGFDFFINKYQRDMDLVIAGRADPHYPEIRLKAMDIQNRDRLVFTGFVEDSDLMALYRGAFAFVSASLNEGCGLPGVEAMSFGLPLAVADTKVFNEIYDNAAVYFDPLKIEDIAAKLDFIVNDRLYYGKLQAAGLQRTQLFDWKITAQKTLEVYNQCLNAKISA